MKIKPQPKKAKLEKDMTLSNDGSTVSNVPIQGLVAYGSDSEEEEE